MNPDGMVALLNYREDGVTRKFPAVLSGYFHTHAASTAYLTFWKDGLKQIKL